MTIDRQSSDDGWQANKLAVSVVEAADRLGVSERHMRTLISRGWVPSVKLGRRVLVPLDLLRDMLRGDDGAEHE